MNELIDPMEFFDKPEEHPDSEQRNTAGMGDHVSEVTSSTALPCCSSLSARKVSMGDVVKDCIDGLNSLAADSAFPPASSSDYVDADAEVFEANVQGSCAPPEPAKAPSLTGSYAAGCNPLMAPNNVFGCFQASPTAPLYPVVYGTDITPPTGLPSSGGLYSNCGLYDASVPPSVIRAFQKYKACEKEEHKAQLKADLETHKAGLTAQLAAQKAAFDAQRDRQRHLYRVEEQDHRADNTIRIEEARELRREARREAALCPFEDSDGYIRIEKKASGRESEFGKRVLKWPHVRMHQIWSARQQRCIALRLSWQTDTGLKEVFLAKTSAKAFVHAMEKAGNPFQCGKEWKQDICEPVNSFLLEHAQREVLPECLGWNLMDGEWMFAWEDALTIEKVVREVENNG